jgi:hypothetical protein
MREFRKMQSEVKDMVKVDLNPEPPTVHQPGVSGPKAQPRPHRTRRPAGQDATKSDTEPVAADVDSASPETSVADAAAGPDPAPDPDGPSAAAGAG